MIKLKGEYAKIQSLQILFNEIQICDTKKYTENLNTCITILNKKNSLNIILSIIYPILLCKKSQIPSKIVLFVKRITEEISTTEEGKATVLSLFHYLITVINSKTTRVRKNSIFLMTILCNLNIVNEIINREILEKISERLFDKEKSVRKEAILFLSKYQNQDLNENTKISSVLKNLCRYDPSNECRKLAFENLEVNLFTFNCIIDRCSDINLGIRNVFYKKFLEKINIRELRQDKRKFLLRKVFTEREIDSIEIFVNCCILYYDLPNEFTSLVVDFYHPGSYKLLEKLVKRLLNLFDLNLSGDKILEDSSFESLLFYEIYLGHIEDTKGKDDTNLIPLSKYVDFLYNHIKHSEEVVEKCKVLFKILNFYDVFDDESRKIINSTVYKLIKNGTNDEILDETIKIVYKIDIKNGDKMFGALIHKHLESNFNYSIKICKYLLKYSTSIDKIQEAIFNEIILNYKDILEDDANMKSDEHDMRKNKADIKSDEHDMRKNKADIKSDEHDIKINETYIKSNETDSLIAELIFFYLNINPNGNIFDTFKRYRERCDTFFKMIVDLTLKFKDKKYLDLATEIFYNLIEKNDVSVIIPGSKLILSQQITDESLIFRYMKFILTFYFNEEDDRIQQYLNVFFHEYFLEDSTVLLDVFCPVYENIEKSEKYFVDRVLFLIENSKKPNGTQTLFYKICVNFYFFYSDTKMIKKFLYVLNKINIIGAWNPLLTKKILFCCTQLMKKPVLTNKFTEYVNSLMSIDDGEPISQEDLRLVKQDLCMA